MSLTMNESSKGRKLTLDVDARGHYTVGKELADDVLDRIRRVIGK